MHMHSCIHPIITPMHLNPAARPAFDSTISPKPIAFNRRTCAGVIGTRRSPANSSRGTPIHLAGGRSGAVSAAADDDDDDDRETDDDAAEPSLLPSANGDDEEDEPLLPNCSFTHASSASRDFLASP